MPYSFSQGRYIHDFQTLPSFEVEKNLQTFATSRSGKGATQIIPWLFENPDTNALVIDPKAEAPLAVLNARSATREFHVVEPFDDDSKIPKEFRAKLNVLDFIDPNSRKAFKEINAIADGLVMRHDPKGEHWDGGGIEVLAGFIAHVLSHPDFAGRRSLVTVRELLTLPAEPFNQIVDQMENNFSCGSLPATAASKINNTGNEANHFISVAVANTKWLDDPYIRDCLRESTFDLREIKTKKMDVYLVLPVDGLRDYGRFLRLFVRMALHYMMQPVDGELKKEEVYFILDEAFSLGYISEIESSMSSMPGFGLHIWSFWQDLNQLWKRYDRTGAGTFFANSSASYFYGVDDQETQEYVSTAAGVIQEHEIGVQPPMKPRINPPPPPRMTYEKGKEVTFFDAFFSNDIEKHVGKFILHDETLEQLEYRLAHQSGDTKDPLANYHRANYEQKIADRVAIYEDLMNQYNHARNVIGRPRVTASEVAQITARIEEKKVAEWALVIRQGVVYIEARHPYFLPKPAKVVSEDPPQLLGSKTESKPQSVNQKKMADGALSVDLTYRRSEEIKRKKPIYKSNNLRWVKDKFGEDGLRFKKHCMQLSQMSANEKRELKKAYDRAIKTSADRQLTLLKKWEEFRRPEDKKALNDEIGFYGEYTYYVFACVS